MNSQSKLLTVHPPFPSTKLGRYADKKGVFIVRQNDAVIYIGSSANINKAIRRLYQKGGALFHLDIRMGLFEVVLSNNRSSVLLQMLKNNLAPVLNYQKTQQIKKSKYQIQQGNRMLLAYLDQSRFEVPGEHQTDVNN